MPKRLIRDWTDSARFDGIAAESERLFVRLIMKADDFGRFHADPRLVKAMCYPLSDHLRANDLTRLLDDLSDRQLILRYEVGGRSYLAIPNFGQRLKQSVAKFPPLEGEEKEWLPDSRNFPELPGSGRNFPSEEKGREVEEEGKGKGVAGGSLCPFLEKVWSMGPILTRTRSSKRQLEAAWKKTSNKPTEELVLRVLAAWVASPDWTKQNGEFAPGIHRWVQNRQWENEPNGGAPDQTTKDW